MTALKVLFIVLAAGSFDPTTHAATNIVTSLGDSGPGTLREAIGDSATGDKITFAVMGTIPLTSGELDIGTSLTIVGPGQNNLTVDGRHLSRVFNIASNAVVNISNLAVSNGYCIGTQGSNGASGGDAHGGGIINFGNLSLAGCLITENEALGGASQNGSGGNGYGGGVCNFGALSIAGCNLNWNAANGGESQTGYGGSAYGGGVHNYGTLNITGCTVSWNGSDGANAFGGGLCSTGTIAVTGCTVRWNQANGSPGAYGGGVCIYNGTASLTGCTLSSNSAEAYATGLGGIANGGALSGAAAMTNCTVTGNQSVSTGGDRYPGAEASGGGLDIGDSLLVSCTISGNSSTGLGSGISDEVSAFTMMNTIVAGNVGQDLDCLTISNGVSYSTLVSGGYNLIENTNNISGLQKTDLGGLNPLLGPLQDNGGPTPTMTLLASSPAINKGNSFGLTTDQRGLPRPVILSGYPVASGGDGSDIGALEVQVSTPPPPPLCISYSGNAVTVYWQNAPGWNLQQNSSLRNTNGWAVISTVMTSNGTNYLNLVNPMGNLFFRLEW